MYLLLGVLAIVAFASDYYYAPYSQQVSLKALARERRLALFYRQIPAVDGLLSNLFGMTARLSVKHIEPHVGEDSAMLYGSVWTYESDTVLGRYHAMFTFKELSATPTSFIYKIRIEPRAIKQILSSPAEFPGMSFYPGMHDKPFSQVLGLELQTIVREMNGKGARRLDIWGTETFLAFDPEGQLAIEMRSPLPNPYVSVLTLPNYDQYMRFHRDYVPQLYVLFEKMFKGPVKVEQTLSYGSSRFPQTDSPQAQFLLIATSGHVYGAVVSIRGDKVDIDVFSIGDKKSTSDKIDRDIHKDNFRLKPSNDGSLQRIEMDLKDLPPKKQP